MDAVKAFNERFGNLVHYLFYNPPQIPTTIQYPLTHLQRVVSCPQGCRVYRASEVHGVLGRLREGVSPQLKLLEPRVIKATGALNIGLLICFSKARLAEELALTMRSWYVRSLSGAQDRSGPLLPSRFRFPVKASSNADEFVRCRRRQPTEKIDVRFPLPAHRAVERRGHLRHAGDQIEILAKRKDQRLGSWGARWPQPLTQWRTTTRPCWRNSRVVLGKIGIAIVSGLGDGRDSGMRTEHEQVATFGKAGCRSHLRPRPPTRLWRQWRQADVAADLVAELGGSAQAAPCGPVGEDAADEGQKASSRKAGCRHGKSGAHAPVSLVEGKGVWREGNAESPANLPGAQGLVT